jgi:hypothetical protein
MKQTYLKLSFVSVLAVLFMLQYACKKDPVIVDDNPANVGKLKFTFAHQVDGQSVIYDSTMYVNAAGNHYQLNEIKYFISDITLHKAGGEKIVLTGNDEIRYLDKDYPSTLNWVTTQNLPAGGYEKVSFTFGITATKNQSNMFVNPPEMNMFWPSYLGGGYHYMMINMKWIDTNNVLVGNAFHLGIGQIRDINGNITGFVQNYFTVTLPGSSFTITEGKTTNIPVIMNIENWFKNPNTFDFDIWGGDIMENQPAMAAAAANGHDVFSTGSITQQ